jgi:periplasmic copper chaperone A
VSTFETIKWEQSVETLFSKIGVEFSGLAGAFCCFASLRILEMIYRLVLFFLCSVVGVARGDDLPIKVENAWLQAVPPVAEATAAYMRIRNLSQSPLKLISASSPIAAKIEPMITTRHQRNGQEVMGMESVESLEIPAGGILELKPGGDHLMVMGLTSHPKEGERVKLTVRFAPGDQRLDVEVPVFKQEPK